MRKRVVIVLMAFVAGLCFTNELMGFDPTSFYLDPINYTPGDSLIPNVAIQDEHQSPFVELWQESDLWTDQLVGSYSSWKELPWLMPAIRRGMNEVDVDRALAEKWEQRTTSIPCSFIPSAKQSIYEIDDAIVTAHFSDGCLTTLRVTQNWRKLGYRR